MCIRPSHEYGLLHAMLTH